jgi:uncharacterized protein (TIGR03435 family)
MNVKMRRVVLLAAGMVAFAALMWVPVHAQLSVSVAKPAILEVASINETRDEQGGKISRQPGGRFISENVRVRDFVNMAFVSDPPLLSQQILGLPAWASVIRYNILAKFATDGGASGANPPSDSGPYVRALLDSRFAFQAHLETREMPVYVLTVAATSSKLKPSPADCAKPENREACGTAYGPGRMSGRNVLFDALVTEITFASQRPVLDRTGLSGRFDIDLQWNPDALAGPIDGRPSIVTAVQDMGLRLESRRESADVLVVDHLEPPTPD